ncbi:TRAP transporter substrate-binding protein [Rhodoligotrophos defluvii]|uniref:TRAP transporter substrate-binding protein n=1 Tax=Rhodoligotrophos defluvii TaxID=2561934 RepID=UPI0010C9ED16|nr:TRAP transporter substrate-binding protein [Rhodoligotrophos defluvii]
MKRLLLIALGAVALMAADQAFAQNHVWDMPNEYPATSIQGEGDRRFGELLHKKSDGQIKIVHHFGGSLGFRSRDQLDAVADGAVVLANTFVPPLGGIDPIFLLSSLPFMAANAKEARLLYEVAKPYYEQVYAAHNQKLLYASPWPQSGLWGRAPADSMQALQGLKLRTYDVNGTRAFQAAGAAPIQLSWADIIPQVSTGGIDAVLTSIESGISASFDDYLKFFTQLNYDSTINMVTMNLDTWNGLSKEHQAAVIEAAKETEDYLWTEIEKVVERRYQTARERGVTVVQDVQDGYREKLRELAEPVIRAWAASAGEKGERLIAEYRARLGQAGE